MHICFLTPRFPYPPLKGDSARVYDQLRTLQHDHQVSLISIAETPVSATDLACVQAMCHTVRVVPLPRLRTLWNIAGGPATREPLQVRYYQTPAVQRQLAQVLAGGTVDVVHATLIRMLPYVWSLAQPPVLVDLIDSLSLNLASRRKQAHGLRRVAYTLEYRRVLAYERAATRHFPALVVQSVADQQTLGSPHVSVLPNGVDETRFPFCPPAGRDPQTLVFVGNMGYPPNEEAALWFAGAVWPLLRARYLALRWEIVGANPGPRVRALATGDNGITVRGRVADVTPYLGRATVAVCPMQSGSGIQTKVLEALSTGTPVVTTTLANRGVQAQPERDLCVADTPAAFAAAVGQLLDDPARCVQLGAAGHAFVERHFQWQGHVQRLVDLYTQLQGQTAAR